MEVDRMNCLERAGKKILSHIVIIEQIGWPPSCWGGIYQPERPVFNRPPQDDETHSEEHKK